MPPNYIPIATASGRLFTTNSPKCGKLFFVYF